MLEFEFYYYNKEDNTTSIKHITAKTRKQATQEFYKENNKNDINLFYVCLV